MDPGSRKKEYKLTDKGLDILLKEIERLRELVRNGDNVIARALEGGEEK